MLVALSGAWTVHWTRHCETAKGYAHDPVMAQFWGAPPMALMTVGDGTLLLGKDWIGLTPALTVDWALWTAGTALGLITAVWIPFRMMTTHDVQPDSAVAGWLMPVVPPMVSAAGGALLIPHLPAGQPRLGGLERRPPAGVRTAQRRFLGFVFRNGFSRFTLGGVGHCGHPAAPDRPGQSRRRRARRPRRSRAASRPGRGNRRCRGR